MSSMDTNQQYALHDGDPSGARQWIAHVRLTPELLQRLQQQPAAVTIQLQAPGGGGAASRATRSGNKKPNSVLTIDGDEPETYELLSFVEDPKVNAVCAFQPDASLAAANGTMDVSGGTDPAGKGYSLFEIGRVHQKLIVQRMLDSTEKDRMKDRHAKSVLESKARTSKLVEATETGPMRRRKPYELLAVARQHPPGVRAPSPATVVEEPAVKRRKIPSALTPAAVDELRSRMSQRAKTPDVQPAAAETKQIDSDTSQAKIFSSDSEADKSPRGRAVLPKTAGSKSTPKPLPQKKAARKATAKRDPTNQSAAKAPTSDAPREAEAVAEAKTTATNNTAESTETKAPETREEALEAAPTVEPVSPRGEKRKADSQEQGVSGTVPVQPLPPVKTTKAEVKKRARPRQSRLPDISFLPQSVQDICKRVSAHITRTAILDAGDHESFAAEHDRLRADWEELDKAYSIESILIDGAHCQLPFAESEEERQSLQSTIQESEKKREGLGLVRDSMATIHKILGSLQASISAYERKTRQQS